MSLAALVDAAVEIELDGHGGRAQRARRAHPRDAGNRRELALQRLRHRGRHGSRAAAGQRRRDPGWSGRSTCGKAPIRQQRIGHDADEQDARHQQRGADRRSDGGRGDAPCSCLRPGEATADIFSRRSGSAPARGSGREGVVSSPRSGGSGSGELYEPLLAQHIIAPAVVPRSETFAGLCDLRPIVLIPSEIGRRNTHVAAGQRAGAGNQPLARSSCQENWPNLSDRACQIWAERISVERHEQLSCSSTVLETAHRLSGIDAVDEQRHAGPATESQGGQTRSARHPALHRENRPDSFGVMKSI